MDLHCELLLDNPIIMLMKEAVCMKEPVCKKEAVCMKEPVCMIDSVSKIEVNGESALLRQRIRLSEYLGF